MLDEFEALLNRLMSCRRIVNAAPARVRVSLGVRAQPTSDDAWALGQLLEHACEVFEMRPLECLVGPVKAPTATDRIVAGRLALGDTLNDLRVTRAQAQLLSQRVAANDPRRNFEQHTVCSATKGQLTVYQRGALDRPAWLLVLPYGVPVELCFALAEVVARDYRFITFEGPDLLATPADFDACLHGVQAHARDVLAVMDHFALAQAHVVGVCAGAIPSLCFAHRHPERVRTLTLGNGAFATHAQSDEDFLSLVERVGGNPDKARVFFRFMSSQDLAQREPEFPHLTMVPYSHSDLLYKFTTAFKHYYQGDLDAQMRSWIEQVEAPTLLVAGERDKLISPAHSRDVARRMKRARLLLDPEGTHLSLMGAPASSILQTMLGFCREHDAVDA